MSKSKAGSKNKSDSAKKIPKRIAGVKIPKGLRDSGNAAVKLAQSPMARELLSAGLAAAAAAVASNARARKAAGQSGAEAADALADVAQAATKSAGEMKTALVAAAGVAAQQFFAAKTGARSAAVPETDPAPLTQVAETEATEPATDAAKSIAPKSSDNGARRARVRAAKPIPVVTN